MFGRKKNDAVLVEGDNVDEVTCQTTNEDDPTVTFTLKGGRKVSLDGDALELQSAAMAAHLKAAGVPIMEDELRAAYEEHVKTCPNCSKLRAARPRA